MDKLDDMQCTSTAVSTLQNGFFSLATACLAVPTAVVASPQCRFLVLAIQEVFLGDNFLQDVLVEFVVTVHPRIVSIFMFPAAAWL